jgi:hypothetical protein
VAVIPALVVVDHPLLLHPMTAHVAASVPVPALHPANVAAVVPQAAIAIAARPQTVIVVATIVEDHNHPPPQELETREIVIAIVIVPQAATEGPAHHLVVGIAMQLQAAIEIQIVVGTAHQEDPAVVKEVLVVVSVAPHQAIVAAVQLKIQLQLLAVAQHAVSQTPTPVAHAVVDQINPLSPVSTQTARLRSGFFYQTWICSHSCQ